MRASSSGFRSGGLLRRGPEIVQEPDRVLARERPAVRVDVAEDGRRRRASSSSGSCRRPSRAASARRRAGRRARRSGTRGRRRRAGRCGQARSFVYHEGPSSRAMVTSGRSTRARCPGDSPLDMAVWDVTGDSPLDMAVWDMSGDSPLDTAVWDAAGGGRAPPPAGVSFSAGGAGEGGGEGPRGEHRGEVLAVLGGRVPVAEGLAERARHQRCGRCDLVRGAG